MAAAWDRVHSRLTHRSAWLDHDGRLLVIHGTLIGCEWTVCPATAIQASMAVVVRHRRTAC